MLDTDACKILWTEIQQLVGTQTHTWKLLCLIMLDPLDAKVHIRKYVSGQLNNNVVQIALKCDFGVAIESERTFRENANSEDGFSSDLDQDGLTQIMGKVATHSSPLEVDPPNLQSTLAIPSGDVVVVEDTIAGASGEPKVATSLASNLPSMIELPPPRSDTPKNPKKKIRLEVDRDVARDLAVSLNSFASMLQINNDSSEDSFEVLQQDES